MKLKVHNTVGHVFRFVGLGSFASILPHPFQAFMDFELCRDLSTEILPRFECTAE